MVARIIDGTRLFIIGDEGLVYAHHRQEIIALNTTATYLWCQIEDGCDKDGMLRTYAETFALPEATAADEINTMLERFHAMGLLELPERRAPTIPPVTRPETDQCLAAGVPPLRDMPVVAEQSYALLGSVFRLRCSDVRQLEWAGPILSNFAVPQETQPAVVVDLQHDGDDIFLYHDGTPIARSGNLDELAPVVKSHLWTTAINNFDYFLNFHAGAVMNGDRCVLLPAAAGSGKSSLTAGMVYGGFPYLSDEVALLLNDFTVRSLPLAMCFKNTGWNIVADYFEEIHELPSHHRGDGKIVKYLPLPARYCSDPDRSYCVEAIIFPAYKAGSPAKLDALPKTQALERLFSECNSIPAGLSTEKVARLVEWIKNIPCFTLEFSDLDAAVSAVRDVLAE